MKALDLFCGAGGASCGMHQAGFDVVAGVDYDNDTYDKNEHIATHDRNLPTETILHNLHDIDPTVLPTTNIDWVHGSPPCQDWSKANPNRGQKKTKKNQLVSRWIHWVDEINPRFATMENVANLLYDYPGYVAKLRLILNDMGYNSKPVVLDAARYGVPQNRMRTYIFAYRTDVPTPDFLVPHETHAPTIRNNINGRTIHKWRTVNDVFGREVFAIPNGCETDSGLHYGEYTPEMFNETLRKPFRGVDTEGYFYIRGGGDQTACRYRKFTVDELKTVQTFPDWYEFCGGVTAIRKQIGNAVPPLLQQRIGEHFIDVAGGQLSLSRYTLST